MLRCVLFSACLFFFGCDARRGIADEVMEDLRLGEVRYLETLSGPTLHDPKFRLTDRVMEGVLAESGQVLSDEKKFTWQRRFFQIPQGMLRYEFVKSSEGSTELARLDSVGSVSKQVYPEARYSYLVKTNSGVSRVQVVLIEELGEWKLGAVFEEGE